MITQDLGIATAYGYAKSKGYTGTEAEFAELMASYATVGQTAVDAKDAAVAAKTAAQTAATTATNKATEATTAATTATTKAGEASTSASTATSAKDTAVSAASTATTKATEATTAAATATSAKTDAVAANTAAQSAKTAAQTAQTGAETAAASVQSSAAQIQTNADDISELKEDTTQLKSELSDIVTFTNLVSDLEFGYYFNSTGNIINDSLSAYSLEYIPVTEGTYYFYTGGGTGSQFLCCMYDENKNFVSRYTGSGSVTKGSFDVDSTTKYIRVSVYKGGDGASELTVSKNYVDAFAERLAVLDYKPGSIGFSSLNESAQAVDRVFYPLSFDMSEEDSINGYADVYGNFVTGDDYKTHIYEILSDCTGYFDCDFVYYSICVYEGNPLGSSAFIPPRYRHNSSEDTAPTADNPLVLRTGQFIAITNTKGMATTGFYINDVGRKSFLKSTIYLQKSQLDQINQGCYASYSNDLLYIYTKTGIGYLQYNFKHDVISSINCDTWRIDALHSVDDKFDERFLATIGGEWECAVRLSGRPDFSGGRMHGDEVTTNIVFIVDGAPYNTTTIENVGMLKFSELRIIEVSTLYDPNDNTTEIAEHTKEYIFTKDNLTLSQHLDWKISDNLEACYLAMLTPSKEYTDMFYSDVDLEPVTSLSAYGNHDGVKRAVQYSNSKGFLCSLELLEYPTGLPGGNMFNMRDNNGGGYNKMYFNVCTSGTITAGTRWTSKAIYSFSVGTPTDAE